MQSKTSDQSQKNIAEIQLYPPSFIDRFMRFVQQLPIPYWSTYLLLFILESTLNFILACKDGWLRPFTFNSIILIFPLWQWGPLAIITYLNMTSETALSNFRPLLDINEDTFKNLRREFTTMPTRGVILSSLMWVIVYLLLTYWAYDAFYVGYGLGKFLQVFIFLEGLIGYATGSIIYYHSLRQLWLVNRTVKMAKRFNLFHLNPVYAFSHLTSRTGISWMIMLALTLLVYPLNLAQGLTEIILGFQVVLALAAFVLPLRFVNYHLVLEKRRLLTEHHQRVETLLAQMHQRLDQNQLSEMPQFNNAINGLNAEHSILTKIPTWPWSAETLTGFLSAVVSPIVLLLIQIAIKKWLGG